MRLADFLWFVWVYGAHIAALTCCIYAWSKGGNTEKIGAGIIGGGWFLTALASYQMPSVWGGIIDIAVFILLLWLVIRSRKPWTCFAAALVLNALIARLFFSLTKFGLYSLGTSLSLWGGWLLLFSLFLGTRKAQRERKHGVVYDNS